MNNQARGTEMIEEELKEKYHFGIVNAPCCGEVRVV